MKKVLFGLSLLAISGAFAVPPPQGPADGSAYWVLHFHGSLKPIAVISAENINFGEIEVGETKREIVKILNQGYGDLVIKKVYLKKGVEFGIKKTTCTKPLSLGQSCEIMLEFKPDKAGDFFDTLVVETNDLQNPTFEINLSGKSIGAVIELPQEEEEQPLPAVENKTENLQPVEVNNSTLQKVATEKPKPKKVEKKQKPKEEKKTPKYTYWVVKPCDTLWDISAKVYGTPLLWAAIYEANRDKIRDPWFISVGERLRIPKLTPAERERYKKESLKLMEKMADRPLGPKCPY